MSVLVTGGFGAIRSFVTRLLHERSEDVVVLDNRPDPRLVRDLVDEIRVVHGDIGHLPTLIDRLDYFGVAPRLGADMGQGRVV
jgi:nucleoside-diphosphate-sugar epimerase